MSAKRTKGFTSPLKEKVAAKLSDEVEYCLHIRTPHQSRNLLCYVFVIASSQGEETKEKGVRTIAKKRDFVCHNCLLQKQKIAKSLENKELYSQ